MLPSSIIFSSVGGEVTGLAIARENSEGRVGWYGALWIHPEVARSLRSPRVDCSLLVSQSAMMCSSRRVARSSAGALRRSSGLPPISASTKRNLENFQQQHGFPTAPQPHQHHHHASAAGGVPKSFLLNGSRTVLEQRPATPYQGKPAVTAPFQSRPKAATVMAQRDQRR